MPKIIVSDSASLVDRWIEAILARCPDLEAVPLADLGDDPAALASVDYALVWAPEPGFLASLPNLKLIVSVGAGLDHLTSDPDLPRHLPTVRMVDPGLTQGMSEYCAWGVLTLHRLFAPLLNSQASGSWDVVHAPIASNARVGVLGFGVLGSKAGEALQALGFQVCGWSRSPKQHDSIPLYHGDEGLDAVLASCDQLVLLMPATDETYKIVNDAFLARCKPGVGIINAGRGSLIDDEALLQALDSGQAGGAVLDVFHQEPLPSDHPYWAHPKVIVTPHVAALTYPETGADHVAAAITALEAGAPLPAVVDWDRGY